MPERQQVKQSGGQVRLEEAAGLQVQGAGSTLSIRKGAAVRPVSLQDQRGAERPRGSKLRDGGGGGGKEKGSILFYVCAHVRVHVFYFTCVCMHAYIYVASQFLCTGLNPRTR